MNENDRNQNDAALSTVLRESRPMPALPPRFQENVWQRIQRSDQPAAVRARFNWLDTLATWILRPQLAFAVAAVLVVTGVGLGWNSGEQLARSEAQARYLATVAPNSLH